MPSMAYVWAGSIRIYSGLPAVGKFRSGLCQSDLKGDGRTSSGRHAFTCPFTSYHSLDFTTFINMRYFDKCFSISTIPSYDQLGLHDSSKSHNVSFSHVSGTLHRWQTLRQLKPQFSPQAALRNGQSPLHPTKTNFQVYSLSPHFTWVKQTVRNQADPYWCWEVWTWIDNVSYWKKIILIPEPRCCHTCFVQIVHVIHHIFKNNTQILFGVGIWEDCRKETSAERWPKFCGAGNGRF